MALSDTVSPPDDPLWRSFERILGFYRIRADKGLVKSQVAIDWTKPLTFQDVAVVARHLGFDVTIHALAGIDIADLRRPTIILLSDSRSLVALPQDEAVPALWVPEGEIDVEALCVSRAKNLYALEFDKRSSISKLGDDKKHEAPWFWELLRKQSRDYVDIAVATFFINVFMLVTPLFNMTVFDRVVPNHASETLTALTIGIVLMFAFNLGFKLIRGHVLGAVVARVATQLDTDFMDHLLRLSISSHKLTVGERFNLFSELQGLRDFFASRLIPALVDLPFFVLSFLVIYAISPIIAFVVAIGVVLMFLVNLVCRVLGDRSNKKAFSELRGKNAALVEILAGASAIRLFNATGLTLFRWRGLAERVADSARRSVNDMALADDLSMTLMSLISIIVVVVGVDAVGRGDLSIGGMVACNMLVMRTLAPVMSLTTVLGRLQQSLSSLRIINNIFYLPVEPRLTVDYEPKAPFTGSMRLKDITFYYPGQVHPALYHLSLEIRPGDRVGLIGRSGAGKSTVTRLLDGSLFPQSGQVFVNDLAFGSIHPAEWRQSLGVVPQDPFVFSGTLRENICLGVKDLVDEVWLQQVLVMSGLDLLMKQASCGLDFDVGEAGARLSGGQRQSLAIARALIRKPQILLLDEPTNGMDSDLENRVRESLQAYTRDKTMVLVTHRTTLLGMVNRLVLIDQGSVAADGPPEMVMRRLEGRPPTGPGGMNV